MNYPCGICNIPGRVTDSLHEPCPTCRREIADWDPPHPSSEEVRSHGLEALVANRARALVFGVTAGATLGALTVLLAPEAARVL